MISKDDCYYLGKTTKSIGLKGDIGAFFDVDNHSKYSKMESVYVDINHKLIPFSISKVTFNKAKIARISFKEITHIDDTPPLLGKELYLPLTSLPELKGNKFYYHEVIGFDVIENDKSIGKIKEVLDNPINPLLVILNDSKKQILIPIQDPFILKVDRIEKQMIVSLPDGYLDIYTS